MSNNQLPQRKAKYILSEVKEIASQRGGKLVSTEYINNSTKLQWMCSQGHTFEADVKHVMTRNQWCPKCHTYLTEELCRFIFENLFNVEFPKIKPEFLKYNQTRLELDGYNENLKLAYEYNGRQHYEICEYKRTQQDVDHQKEMDKFKLDKCVENNIKLIIIPFTVTKIDIIDYIKNKCKEYGLKFDDNIQIDLNKFTTDYSYTESRLRKIKKIVEEKHGVCLTNTYIGVNTMMKFRCENNHEWETKAASIIGGHWCPTCGIENKIIKKIHNRQKKKINSDKINYDKIKEEIEKQKLILLTEKEKVINKHSLLTFECTICKFQFDNTYFAMKTRIRRNRPCPKCVKEEIFGLNAINEICVKHDLTCLSDNYKDDRTLLKFRCQKNHEFECTYAALRERIRRNRMKHDYICVECKHASK